MAEETTVPPPEKTTATVAGYGVDDILKAPVQPPQPRPGEHGPSVAEKMNQAGYQASEKIGPARPGIANLVLVGLGVFICLLGLLGFFFLSLGLALTILILGFVTTVVGSFVHL